MRWRRVILAALMVLALVATGAAALAAAPGLAAIGGPSKPLGPVTKTSGCRVRVHGTLPDRGCTPGAVFTEATRARVCRRGYTKTVRHVTEATKDRVYRSYGIRHRRPYEYEVDHLVALELGGSNARSNLWPEAYAGRRGARRKDVIENDLHSRICSGRMSLRRAQRLTAGDWRRVGH